MRGFGPRALAPRDGWNWLIQAWQLMRRRPWLFVAVALFAPTGSALLLALPVWDWWLPVGGWLTLTATVLCYGLPLSLTVSLACGLARAINRKRPLASNQLLNRTAVKALSRAALFLFLLLLQGYLLAYWVQDQLLAADATAGDAPSLPATFGIAGTILGTQLSVLGGALLILQIVLAVFAVPLQLFRELPLAVCWRRSALAMQLNPWLFLVLGMVGLALLALPFFKPFAVLAQILALPLPVYLGVLLYVAWNDVFQSGAEEEEMLEMQEQWRAGVSGGSVSRQSGGASATTREPVDRFAAAPDKPASERSNRVRGR